MIAQNPSFGVLQHDTFPMGWPTFPAKLTQSYLRYG